MTSPPLPFKLQRELPDGIDPQAVELYVPVPGGLGAAWGETHLVFVTGRLIALAQESVFFEFALSPVTVTLPAHTSILTGTHPLEHGVLANLAQGKRRFETRPGLRSFAEFAGSLGKVTVDGTKVRLCLTSQDVLEWIKETDVTWGTIEGTWMDVNVPTDVPQGHLVIEQNFIDAIIDGVPLIAPGEEGITSLELANAMVLSAKRRKEVPLPLDRAEYDTLMDELCAESRFKG